MAGNARSKTLHYLRSVFDDQPHNLEGSLRVVLRRRRSCKASEWEMEDRSIIRIQHRRMGGSAKPLLLHLVRYVPGEKAATLDPDPEGTEDDGGEQRPPRGREFKSGECFLLVKDADVLFCASGVTSAAARHYARCLFIACGIEADLCDFDLRPAADLDRLAIIRKRGVSSIQLGSVAFDASRSLLPGRTSFGRRVLKSVSDQVSALVAKDDTVLEQRVLEDLIVNVELKLQGNSQADVEAQRSIDDMAVHMLQTEEPNRGFVIVTRDGNRLTDIAVKLHKRIKVLADNNSIDHESVWSEMRSYYEELHDGKLLET